MLGNFEQVFCNRRVLRRYEEDVVDFCLSIFLSSPYLNLCWDS
jgi:hypothetical protein